MEIVNREMLLEIFSGSILYSRLKPTATLIKHTVVYYFFTKTKSHTPCPNRLPRASNFVSGRYAGTGA